MAISKTKKRNLVESQNHHCALCGCPIHLSMAYGINLKDAEATMDHIIPQVDGGSDSYDNLVAACYHCNCLRGSMPIMDYYELLIVSDENFYDRFMEIVPIVYQTKKQKSNFYDARKRYRKNFPFENT